MALNRITFIKKSQHSRADNKNKSLEKGGGEGGLT